VLAQIDANGRKGFQVDFLNIAGRGLQHDLKLRVLEKAVGVLTVAPVSGAAGGLSIGHRKRLWIKNAQKGLRRHGAGAHLHVIRLLQNASALGPKGLQTKEEFLEGKCAGCLQSHGWILNQALSSSVPKCVLGAGVPLPSLVHGFNSATLDSLCRGGRKLRSFKEEFAMQSRIVGTTMPVLEFTLGPNESVISEAGELSWMSSSIQMQTHTQLGGGGGFFGALKRVAGGGSLFMTEYRAMGAAGEVAFATRVPGHIQVVQVGPGLEYLIHRHGFLCATPGIQLGVGFQQSLGAGVFGGDGFLLQKVTGQGAAWIELSGELIVKDLAAGETLRVHPGHVGAFQSSVSFQITRIAGIKNMIFGGDGIFLAALTGPGRVWLQTLPISKLAHQLMQYMPSAARERTEGGVVGGIVGSLLNG
jgi:uncharacterized protein (TIGR00266 family)